MRGTIIVALTAMLVGIMPAKADAVLSAGLLCRVIDNAGDVVPCKFSALHRTVSATIEGSSDGLLQHDSQPAETRDHISRRAMDAINSNAPQREKSSGVLSSSAALKIVLNRMPRKRLRPILPTSPLPLFSSQR